MGEERKLVMHRFMLFVLTLVASLIAGCIAAPAYEGEESARFDGKYFKNTVPMSKSVGDLLRLAWGTLTQAEDWPNWIDVGQGQVPEERVWSGMAVTYVNHSTFLIQVDGFNILTDPIYSERASPFQWAGPKRVHVPGIALEDLPPIDVILISHNHYDHLDEASLRALLGRSSAAAPMLLSGLGNKQLLASLGASRVRELDWEEGVELGGIDFVFTEGRHRSGRGLSDQMKTLWGSFVIKTSEGNIYFAGDTGYGGHFAEAGERHGPFALSLLPIGAYAPRWFMKDVHLNPEEAVKAHQQLESELSIGIHFGTFQLTYEAIDQPLIDLSSAKGAHELLDKEFVVMKPGETLGIVSAPKAM
ncbi:MBL fold metallo-hydrolase [Congregibacter sp.]|uniref:MBL fold metallo-hydrolase n=1 Tax=Congregibacter sp. TaxID=2744308 RepID=UPI00385A3790